MILHIIIILLIRDMIKEYIWRQLDLDEQYINIFLQPKMWLKR